MDFIKNFFNGIYGAIFNRLLTEASPFVIQEAKALSEKVIDLVGILTDQTITSDERSRLFAAEFDGFKVLLAQAEQEGSQLASDILSIITQAVADNVLGSLGLKENVR